PDSVESNHLSRTGVATGLERPTWTWPGRLVTVLLGLAPGGVYLCTPCHHGAGALLPHHFTLAGRRFTCDRRLWRCRFCGTFPRVSPGRRYRPPCPAVSGLSSKAHLRGCSACMDNSRATPREAPDPGGRSTGLVQASTAAPRRELRRSRDADHQ